MTRSMPPPLMMVVAAPAPVMVSLLPKSAMSRSPVPPAFSPVPALVRK